MVSTLQNSGIGSKHIHVLHVASGDLWAGAEVMLYTLVKAMHTEPGVQVTVILLNHGTLEHRLRDCGISMFIIDESRYNSIQIFRQLNRIIGDIRPDVIHTHRLKENILGGLAAWRNHIPSIRTSHGAPEHRPPLYKLPKRVILLLDWLVGRFYQRYIIAVSSDLAEKLEDDFPRSKIVVIENGIDIDALTRNIPRNHPEKAENKSYKIGIAGRLVPVKRIDLFIQTAVYFKRDHPELSTSFYIYGDGPLRDSLQALVQSQQAANYIHFEGHCENITQEIQKLDALLMTSDHEGLPMILLESMGLHIPIIAHAVGGIPNLLDQGRCGTLIKEHTAKAFAEAIHDLSKQPEQHRKLADQAYIRIEQKYSANHCAESYLGMYKRFLDS